MQRQKRPRNKAAILNALNEGANTTNKIRVKTGLSANTITNTLSTLRAGGVVEIAEANAVHHSAPALGPDSME